MKPFAVMDINVNLTLPGGDRVVVINPDVFCDELCKQRNVFRLSRDNAVVWQLGDYSGMPGLSTFTNIYFDEAGTLTGYNFDGGEYRIDIDTGACEPARLIK